MVTKPRRAPASAARLVNVPIDRVHLPDSVEYPARTTQQALEVEPGAERIANLLRPPLLVPDEGQPGNYLVVGNQPTFLHQLRLAGTDAARSPTIVAIVIERDDSDTEMIAPLIEQHFVPLLFGGLSVRKAAAARRKLREAGLVPPRPLTTRAAVRRIVKRAVADTDA